MGTLHEKIQTTIDDHCREVGEEQPPLIILLRENVGEFVPSTFMTSRLKSKPKVDANTGRSFNLLFPIDESGKPTRILGKNNVQLFISPAGVSSKKRMPTSDVDDGSVIF